MEQLQRELYQAAARTFEDLAFMFPVPESKFTAETEGKSVSVAFTGLFDGRLLVTAQSRLLPVIAANMLGEEDATTEAQQWDALGEVANVSCGNILPSIGGLTTVFRLDAPKPAETVSGATPTASATLSFEEGCVGLYLYVAGHGTPDGAWN